MKLLKMKVRTVLIAVAIVALIMACGLTLERRRQRFLKLYREHALAEFERTVKARFLEANVGRKKGPDGLPSLPEIAEMWRLNAEERRLLEADAEDLHAMISEAGWKTAKSIPVQIDINQTLDQGGLGKLLRDADYHQRMRRKYQRAAHRPWLELEADPPPPGP
jgi:hypothetical protein